MRIVLLLGFLLRPMLLVAQDKSVKVKKVPIPMTYAGSGSEMFNAYCASCHGVSGKGDGRVALAEGNSRQSYL